MRADIEDVVARLRTVHGRRVDALYQAYLMGDSSERREIEQVLRLLHARIEGLAGETRVLLPPPPGGIPGDFPLGAIMFNDRSVGSLALTEDELVQHTGVFGRSGSGKTNLIRQLLKGFLANEKPFLIFDWKKDYSELYFGKVFGGIGDCAPEILVFPVGKRNLNGLRFNPLIPPEGTDPAVWAKKLCEILTHAYVGGAGFESLFLKAMDALYSKFGVYGGQATRFPTMADLRDYLENLKTKGRESQWMQSVMRTLTTLCFGGMGDTLNAPSQTPIEDLLERNVIFELDALSNADKTFFIESMLLWIHHYRLGQPQRGGMRHAIIIEEAHHILRQQYGDDETVVDIILREVRSLGEAVVIVDQMPSLISKVGLANTYCTIGLNLKTADDINALSRCMLLSGKEKDYLGMLPVGSAIVKLQDRWFRPMMVKVPFVPAVQRPRQTHTVLHVVTPSPSVSPVDGVQSERVPQIPDPSESPRPSEARDERVPRTVKSTCESESRRDRPEDTLLLDIHHHPTDPVTTRYKRLGVSARQGNRWKDALLKRELIVPETISGLSGWFRLFRITEPGISELVRLGKAPRSGRAGSLEHQYWQTAIADHFRGQGWVVDVEHPVGGGRAVDLVARPSSDASDADSIAIEVETGRSDWQGNVQKCLDAGFGEVRCVTTRNELAVRMRRIGTTGLARVSTARQLLSR